MKIKDGYIVREVAGQYMAVPVGTRAKELRGVVALNESAVFLWNLLKTEQSNESLAQSLVNEFDVSYEQALASVKSYTDAAREAGLLLD